MKYKTLFRLLLKIVGVFVFALGAGTFFSYVGWVLEVATGRYGGTTTNYARFIYNLIGPAAQMAFGAYLFFGGRWITDLAIPGNRNYCHECGYDLTGATGNVCNECGTPFQSQPSTPED